MQTAKYTFFIHAEKVTTTTNKYSTQKCIDNYSHFYVNNLYIII